MTGRLTDSDAASPTAVAGPAEATGAAVEVESGANASRRPAVIVLAGAAVFYAVFIVRTGFRIGGQRYFTLFDDAMVSMRYAYNLAHGHGLVWNAGGTPVEGYTNPAWTVWMAALHLTGAPLRLTSLLVMMSGAAILLANLALVMRLARRLVITGPTAAVVVASGVVVALYYPLVYWTLRGMEVGLLALLVTAAVLLALRLRDTATDRRALVGLAAVLCLAVLTRTDMALPAAIIIAFVVLTVRRDRRFVLGAVLAGAVGLTLGAHALFEARYYGDALPNTYYLKLHGITLATRVGRGAAGLGYLFITELYAPIAFALAYFLVARRRAHAGAVLLGALFVAQAFYSVYVGGDAWDDAAFANRYLAVAVPGLLVLAVFGVTTMLRADAPTQRRAWWLVAGVSLVAGILAVVDPVPVERFQLHASHVPALRTVPAFLIAAVAAGAALFSGRATRPAGRIWWMAGAAGVLVLAVSGWPLAQWGDRNAQGVGFDQFMARYGVALSRVTSRDASVSVVLAGAVPYFDRRPSIDMLGKSDSVIAKEEPRAVEFRPGHNKWDYARSVRDLRPDLVAQVWTASSPAELCQIRSWGYDQVAPTVFVRHDTHAVDRNALERTLQELGLGFRVGDGPPACDT